MGASYSCGAQGNSAPHIKLLWFLILNLFRLQVVLLMGNSPRRLLAAFMGLTAFISMWINNTATTSLMVGNFTMLCVSPISHCLTQAPIALAVLNQMNQHVTQGDEDVELTEVPHQRTNSTNNQESQTVRKRRDKGIDYHTLGDSRQRSNSGEDDSNEQTVDEETPSLNELSGEDNERGKTSSFTSISSEDVALDDADPDRDPLADSAAGNDCEVC